MSSRVVTLTPQSPADLVCPSCGSRDWDVIGRYRWTAGEIDGAYTDHAKITRHGAMQCTCGACGDIEPVSRAEYERLAMEQVASALVSQLPPKYQAALPKVIAALETAVKG